MATIKLSAPWVEHYRKIKAMFEYDLDITVLYDEDNLIVELYVDDPVKADALEHLMKKEVSFGDTVLKVNVYPANRFKLSEKDSTQNICEMFDRAFKENPAYSFSKAVGGIFAYDLIYVVFNRQVVQYFNDNLGDLYGQCSTLYQEIAKDIFDVGSPVFYCTSVRSKDNMYF